MTAAVVVVKGCQGVVLGTGEGEEGSGGGGGRKTSDICKGERENGGISLGECGVWGGALCVCARSTTTVGGVDVHVGA